MNPPREIELKLEVPEQALARLTRSPLLRMVQNKTRRPASLVSVYCDTDRQKLRKHGLPPLEPLPARAQKGAVGRPPISEAPTP